MRQLIEIYKGIQIFHNAEKDQFETNVVASVTNGKTEYVCAGRLQKTRTEIDKHLNTTIKKPAVKKAWLKSRGYDTYEKVDVIMFNVLSSEYLILIDGKQRSVKPSQWSDRDELFISCKENDAIIKSLNEKHSVISKIKKEISCASGKLIPMTKEHFK